MRFCIFVIKKKNKVVLYWPERAFFNHFHYMSFQFHLNCTITFISKNSMWMGMLVK